MRPFGQLGWGGRGKSSAIAEPFLRLLILEAGAVKRFAAEFINGLAQPVDSGRLLRFLHPGTVALRTADIKREAPAVFLARLDPKHSVLDELATIRPEPAVAHFYASAAIRASGIPPPDGDEL
jgi:hypothetical protein